MVSFTTKIIRPKIARVINDSGAIVGTATYTPSAVATQGQLKQFTVAAVGELNADLTNTGGAGAALTNLVYGWKQDYVTNGYATNTANPTRPYKASDYQAVNVGQLKYIASLVYAQLANAGYTGLYPSWIVQNTATDNMAANIGQIKQAFNFDLSLPGATGFAASSNNNGTVNLSWTAPANNQATSYQVEQQAPNGTWQVIANLPASATFYAVTNLAAGESPAFQIIAQKGRSASIAQTTPVDSGLIPPSNVHGVAGPTDGEIDLSWQNNATDATYMRIEESTDGVNWSTIATPSTNLMTYPVTNLIVGQNYYFRVSAGNN